MIWFCGQMIELCKIEKIRCLMSNWMSSCGFLSILVQFLSCGFDVLRQFYIDYITVNMYIDHLESSYILGLL